MSKTRQITRRTVLKGFGTAVTLPLLDAMLPRAASAAIEAHPTAAPLRMAFVYVPNGMHMPDWTPQTEGGGFDLPSILEPLGSLKKDVCVLSGLTHQKANANGDGGGDHARALTTFLTGVQAKKTHGADIRAGVSVDQVAAGQIGRFTRFPSLEIGCDAGGQTGNCDSGYSCAYSTNISWKNATQPIPKEVNPRLVFERLFTDGRPGESAEARARRHRDHKSILDFVQEDARRLKQSLGMTDRRKLDEYLTAVRELEVRIEGAEKPLAGGPVSAFPTPKGIPESYEQHIRLLADLLVLAFQTDTTRISTFVFANEGSNRGYPFLNVPEGHHDLSHHGGDKTKQEKIRTINHFHFTQFAYLLAKLKAVREGERSLLDNCMIVYGSGIGDGNAHNHNDLPILLAGKAGNTITAGRHIKYPTGTPLTNLYLSLLDRMHVDCEKLGDSSGRLSGLQA